MALTRFKMASARQFFVFFSLVSASFHLIVLKFGMYVYLNDSLDEFENGTDQIQDGPPLGHFWCFFSGCKRDSVDSFNLFVLKLCMYVHLGNSSDEFENGADQIQNGRRSAIS